MIVYFEPDKKWWQPWKRNRYLVKGKDFEVSEGILKTNKLLKGKFTIDYHVSL